MDTRTQPEPTPKVDLAEVCEPTIEFILSKDIIVQDNMLTHIIDVVYNTRRNEFDEVRARLDELDSSISHLENIHTRGSHA